MTDITFETDDGYFIYKVGAIIIHENKVLMVKNANFPYYYPVGGRVAFGETSETAAKREAVEETNVKFEIDRLAFVHENFFVDNIFGGAAVPNHAIELYYLMKTPDDMTNMTEGSIGADGGVESLHWLPIDKLSDYPVFPEFYKTELQNLTNEVKHFVTKDNTSRAK